MLGGTNIMGREAKIHPCTVKLFQRKRHKTRGSPYHIRLRKKTGRLEARIQSKGVNGGKSVLEAATCLFWIWKAHLWDLTIHRQLIMTEKEKVEVLSFLPLSSLITCQLTTQPSEIWFGRWRLGKQHPLPL